MRPRFIRLWRGEGCSRGLWGIRFGSLNGRYSRRILLVVTSQVLSLWLTIAAARTTRATARVARRTHSARVGRYGHARLLKQVVHVDLE